MTATERLAATKVELARITDSWGLLDPNLKPYRLQISALVGSNTVLVAALEAVLELHQPFEWSFGYGPVQSCEHCAEQGADEDRAQYPCPTVKAVTEALGADQ